MDGETGSTGSWPRDLSSDGSLPAIATINQIITDKYPSVGKFRTEPVNLLPTPAIGPTGPRPKGVRTDARKPSTPADSQLQQRISANGRSPADMSIEDACGRPMVPRTIPGAPQAHGPAWATRW